MKNFLAAFFLISLANLSAQEVDTGHAKASLVANKSLSDEYFYVGIKLQMDSGWHTYWKNPGDSGGPFSVQWSHNLDIIIENVSWPIPQIIPYDPLVTYGYKDFVIFPFKVFKQPNSSLGLLSAKIEFLICSDICIPENATLSIDLSEKHDSLELLETVRKLPSKNIPVNVQASQEKIIIEFTYDNTPKTAYLFVETEDIVEYLPAHSLTKVNDNTFAIELTRQGNEFSGIKGILALDDKVYLVESFRDSTKETTLLLWQAILFAFLGGIILNLMPCVFPVISLKVMSFLKLADSNPALIKMHALTFSGGVLFTFIAISLLLLGLKSTGEYIGWGFQLQSPEIVGSLAILMTIIGFILLTDININISNLYFSQSVTQTSGLSNSFWTGALAVIVASPCTAPFMGAALGYAIIQPSFVSLLVFIALAMGFALPYLILAWKPKLIELLPKPGKWMEILKKFFAFPMFATAIWLLWVFSQQTHDNDLILLLAMCLLASFGTWILSHKSKIASLIGAIFVITAFFLTSTVQKSSVSEKNSNAQWSLQTENILRLQNQAYLINFTAAWCITCQTNEQLVLGTKEVQDFLSKQDIRYIKADWTNRNEEIAVGLEKYARSGVPLYIFWKPGMTESAILPAILRKKDILDL
ncbi:MAG: protein-disulfide reductase DsbD domain-containing protein [Gammaproteobacteria bacterium]